MTPPIDLDRYVVAHTAIKDERTRLKRAFEAADEALKENQQVLRAAMLKHLNDTNSKSAATAHGTVYRTTTLKPSAADWTAIYTWVAANPDRFELLEKRLKSTFIQDYMDENEGALPPGVNTHRQFDVGVRRDSSAGDT